MFSCHLMHYAHILWTDSVLFSVSKDLSIGIKPPSLHYRRSHSYKITIMTVKKDVTLYFSKMKELSWLLSILYIETHNTYQNIS